jgi:adenosylcobinamide-GDP ribazoletransferase
MASWGWAFLSGVQFLTRIPVPSNVPFDDDSLPRATVFFPVIGALVGGVGALAYRLTHGHWNAVVAATLAVTSMVLVTGAFHEDGLADAADGLGGGTTRERALEIMRDSRIGAYGAVALVLLLVLRIGLIASMSISIATTALVAAHTLGRWSSLPLIHWLPYARGHEGGTAKPFAAAVSAGRLAAGTAAAVAIVLIALGGRALLPLGLATAITLLAASYFRQRLGGMTGDCLGAANVVVEVGVLLALA